MVFISHSSKDKDFAEALVVLLEDMGFDSSNLFCSSIDGYGIGLSEDIFDTLRSLFNEHSLYVIFIHSPRYYKSAVSLNEMGAAWVLRTDFCSFLTTDMDFSQMNGVVNSNTISIKVDGADAPARLNELKEKLIAMFSLNAMDGTKWERKRQAFLDKVLTIQYANESDDEEETIIDLSEAEIQILKDWTASDMRVSMQQTYRGGRKVYYLGKSYEVIGAEEHAEWEAFFERLVAFGFVEQIIDKNGYPQYKLKKAAYDYVKSLDTTA